jgi:hypothetical protein
MKAGSGASKARPLVGAEGPERERDGEEGNECLRYRGVATASQADQQSKSA